MIGNGAGASTGAGASAEVDEIDDDFVEADIAVLGGNPDATDLAAVTAVLSEVLGELAEEQGRREAAVVSAWGRSQRTLRAPLHAQAGAWRSFSG